MLAVLKKTIKEHKRVCFDGDGYSPEWHKEAARRGLPHLRDSVEAFPVLKAKKTVDLFKKYGVLTKAEVESRYHIAVEKYVKQLGIEAEMMISMTRTMILPAAIRHQTMLANAVTATEGAGVDCDDTVKALEGFAGLVTHGAQGAGRGGIVGGARGRGSAPPRDAFPLEGAAGDGDAARGGG